MPDIETAEHAAAEEAQQNARSIAAIPPEQLPWPEVRGALIFRALAGYDCYAYIPMGDYIWRIWDRQEQPWMESRFTPRAWAEKHGYRLGASSDEPGSLAGLDSLTGQDSLKGSDAQ